MDPVERVKLITQQSPFSENTKLWALYGTSPSSSTLPTRSSRLSLESVLANVKSDYNQLYSDTLAKQEQAQLNVKDLEALVATLKTEIHGLHEENAQLRQRANSNGESGAPSFGAKDQKIGLLKTDLEKVEARNLSLIEAMEALQLSSSSQAKTIELLKTQLEERERKIHALENDIASKELLYHMNSKEFDEGCLKELKSLGIHVPLREVSSIHSLIVFFVQEIRSLMTTVNTLKTNQVQGYNSVRITEMESELFTLRKSSQHLAEKQKEIASLSAKVGELSAQIEWAHNVKLESEQLSKRVIELEAAVLNKEKIIKEYSGAFNFFQTTGDHSNQNHIQKNNGGMGQIAHSALSAQEQAEHTENISTLTSLLKKFKDDYNFLYSEYMHLRTSLHPEVTVSRKRSGDQMALEKKKSTSEHQMQSDSQAMDEESHLHHSKPKPRTGGFSSVAEYISLVEKVFGWHIELQGESAKVSSVASSSFEVTLSSGFSVQFSPALESLVATEAPDILTLSTDLPFLMANLTMLITRD